MANTIKPTQAAIDAMESMRTLDDMLAAIDKFGIADSEYKVGTKIVVHNKMQKDYEYELTEPVGENFASDFKPRYTPSQMLTEGVFGGKYCNDQWVEYPASWYKDTRLSPEGNNSLMNRFKGESRTPLQSWKSEGWLNSIDPRGWFEWYMRYYLGRRVEDDFQGQPYDRYQINRWKSFARHFGQVKANCDANDMECRPNQRQALLQWSWPAYGLQPKWVDFKPPAGNKDNEEK